MVIVRQDSQLGCCYLVTLFTDQSGVCRAKCGQMLWPFGSAATGQQIRLYALFSERATIWGMGVTGWRKLLEVISGACPISLRSMKLPYSWACLDHPPQLIPGATPQVPRSNLNMCWRGWLQNMGLIR